MHHIGKYPGISEILIFLYLVAYKLKKNWDAKIRLVTVVDDEEQEVAALTLWMN